MSIVQTIRLKIYYLFAKRWINGKPVHLPERDQSKKHLFLYFDYEREFGGHETNITDRDISLLLDILDTFQIKTTWFTVGKIFERYPDSITDILKRGHELASHTFSHIPPYYASAKELESDFKHFEDSSNMFPKVKGFHAPNGLWSLNSLSLLSSSVLQ